MPVSSHGVIARTFGSPVVADVVAAAAAACCLLKFVAHPWTLKGGVKPRHGKTSSVIETRTRNWVLVLCNALEITVEERSRIELGPNWVLVLVNALEITVEQSPLALQIFLHDHYDCLEKWLKRLVFSSKLPTPWHHGMGHALFPTHLHSFGGPITMEEQRASLEAPTRQTNDRLEF